MSIIAKKSGATSKPQEKSGQEQLLDDLKNTPVGELAAGAAQSEGLNGATLKPLYSTRHLKCYTITDSEIQQIGIANIGITAFASLGSAFFAFGLDIYKDTLLAENIPDVARMIAEYARPICFALGAAFWIIAGCAYFWRRGMISTIKKESVDS